MLMFFGRSLSRASSFWLRSLSYSLGSLSALPQLSLSSLLCQHKASDRRSLKYLVLLGKYLNRVDRVMTQVDKISEDIEHIPVATFIFRDSESVMVNYTSDKRLGIRIKFDLQIEVIEFQAPQFSCSGKVQFLFDLLSVISVKIK